MHGFKNLHKTIKSLLHPINFFPVTINYYIFLVVKKVKIKYCTKRHLTYRSIIGEKQGRLLRNAKQNKTKRTVLLHIAYVEE